MIFSFFSALIYFSILFFFGWQSAQFFLKENRIEHLLGLGGIFGVSFYIILTNALGYFIPITAVFYLVLSLFFVIGLALLHFNKEKTLIWGVNGKWKKILLVSFLFLIVSSSIVYLRYPFDLSALREPTAATIAEGNFPPTSIWQPGTLLNYHYAPELFAASLHKTTGLPLYLAYDFQVGVLAGILFLLGFCLIKRLCGDNFKSLFASFSMIYVGTLSFFSTFKGIPVLYDLYVSHKAISAPFKFIGEAISPQHTTLIIKHISANPWAKLAFPLMLFIVYLYFYLIEQEKINKIACLFGGLFLAILALVAEPYFAVFCLILLAFPFLYGFAKKDWKKSKKFLSVSLLILVVALPVAFCQGGLFKSLSLPFLGSETSQEASFTSFSGSINELFQINTTPWVLRIGGETSVYHSQFLIEWVLLVVLSVFAFIFLFKQHFRMGLFLLSLLLVCFFTPFLINLSDEVYSIEMKRFFYPVSLFGGLVAGLFLAHIYLSIKKKFKPLIFLLMVILMAQGLIFQGVYLFSGSPAKTWNPNAALYATADSMEGKAYDWVKKNTKADDYFLIIKDDYVRSGAPNYQFILNTGRLAPIYAYQWLDELHYSRASEDLFGLFLEVRESCDSSVLRQLRYNYLYVDENWREGMEEKCLIENDLELKFEIAEDDKFVRIYKLRLVQ